ncbi:hypothetical protein [Mycobacterium sp.]|uniref:hypothetical protein n=1 Tax=Mycobacterium sp. TaxID=1785 RepID=UPI002BA0A983|nr:hypothetical protein [Mycobacterium sp.]HTQ20620.1 hypothetical protein [Mycobacterium sp.]
MLSTNASEFDADLERIAVALTLCAGLSFDEMTGSELCEVWEFYDLVQGRLAALRYELTSPFARPGTRGQTSDEAA